MAGRFPSQTFPGGQLERGWFPSGARISQARRAVLAFTECTICGWWKCGSLLRLLQPPTPPGRVSHIGPLPWTLTAVFPDLQSPRIDPGAILGYSRLIECGIRFRRGRHNWEVSEHRNVLERWLAPSTVSSLPGRFRQFSHRFTVGLGAVLAPRSTRKSPSGSSEGL